MIDSDPSFWKWLAGGAVSAIGGIWGGIKYIDNKLEKKADKDRVNREFLELKDEMGTQRQNIGKIFDQIRQNEQRAQDRHERLMDKINT